MGKTNEIAKRPPKPSLGSNYADKTAALARAVAGGVPIAGPFLAEVLTVAIPNQRLDRIEAFLLLLGEELERLSASEKASQPSSVPLIEEGLSQAARAFTNKRREYLAKCVAHGVNADEQAKLAELKILQLLSELGDDDLLLLDAINERDGWEKLRALQPPQLFVNAPDEERAKGELHRAAYRKLVSIGLLSFSMYTDELKLPKYERSGELEGHHYVSALGRQVLVRVGLAASKDDGPPASTHF